MKISIMQNPVMASAFVCTSLVLASPSTYAQKVIVDENYEALSVGAKDPVWPAGRGTTSWNTASEVVDDTSDIFGARNARHLKVVSSGTYIFTQATFTNTTNLVYVGFDFILDSSHSEVGFSVGDSVNSRAFVDVRFRGAASPFGASLENTVKFEGDEGPQLSGMTAGTRFRLELVLNNDAVARSYAGVGYIATDQTIAAGTYDIFLRNTATGTTAQVGDDVAQRGDGGIDRLTWTNYDGRAVNFSLDNVNIELIP